MSSSQTPIAPDEGGEDPWAAFGYLVAGVLFYGLVGWGLSVWLHAGYWIPVGILVGAGFGMYMAFARYRVAAVTGKASPASNPHDKIPNEPAHDEVPHDGAARNTRPDSDDRGETA
ncbi:MAG: hypothetical protein M3Y42_06745 [Actinomycetota bacterium]|nr:hypothetical protein [Actinomycetota bacterium]MDQ2956642.1 hypothetical protein [Actinomycetota bacterium]